MGTKSTLKDMIYDYIAKEIASGNLVPQKRINELELSEKLGVSRTPIRETLFLMVSEGILENVPRKGFFVKSLDDSKVKELYVIIGALDGLCAGIACGNMPSNVLDDLDYYAESLELAIKMENYSMYYHQQELFHKAYMDYCGNSTLVENIEMLKHKLVKKGYDISEDKKQEILFKTNREHRKIAELFRENKPEELRSFIESVHWNPEKATYESFK